MKNILPPYPLLTHSSSSGRLPAQEKYRPLGDFFDRHECPVFHDTRFTHQLKPGLPDFL
jgi:hypothetical protein